MLYKRRAEPDEALVQMLEGCLKDLGCEVFLDRHLTVGTRGADEVERKIQQADFVSPVLSAASTGSEMLDYKIDAAYQAAHAQRGLPHLLPIRVNYEGQLSDRQEAILKPIQYLLWSGPLDDASLIESLVSSIHAPQVTIDPDMLETPTGAVPQSSPFYIERAVDRRLKSALARREGTILVKGARQMGKTSLLARGLDMARETKARVVYTDYQMLGERHLASPDTLLKTLATMLAEELTAQCGGETGNGRFHGEAGGRVERALRTPATQPRGDRAVLPSGTRAALSCAARYERNGPTATDAGQTGEGCG